MEGRRCACFRYHCLPGPFSQLALEETGSVLVRRVVRNPAAIKAVLALVAAGASLGDGGHPASAAGGQELAAGDLGPDRWADVATQVLQDLLALLDGDRWSHSPRNKESLSECQVPSLHFGEPVLVSSFSCLSLRHMALNFMFILFLSYS